MKKKEKIMKSVSFYLYILYDDNTIKFKYRHNLQLYIDEIIIINCENNSYELIVECGFMITINFD